MMRNAFRFNPVNEQWRKLLVGITLLFSVLVMGGSVSSSTYLPGTAVWMADHKTVYQIDPYTNTIFNAIEVPDEISDIAADPGDGSIWVLTHQRVYKFNDQTENLVNQTLANTDPNLASPDSMHLNPDDGSIWIVAKSNAAHLDSFGNLLSIWSSPYGGAIDFLDLDLDGSVWFLSSSRLIHAADNGVTILEYDYSAWIDNANRLAVDSLGGVVWLLSDKTLIYLAESANGLIPSPVAFSDPAGIQSIALNPLTGSLWVTSNDTIYRFGRDGSLELTTPIPQSLRPVETITVEPLTNTIWLGTKKALVNIAETGEVIAEFPVNNKLEAVVATASSVSPSPTLSIGYPADGALINDAKPTLSLELGALCGILVCDPGPSYFGAMGFNVILNGVNIGSEFASSGTTATYTPALSLPEGRNTLQAYVVDMFGKVSNRPLIGFTVDTVPPLFTSLSPVDGAVIEGDSALITGSVDDSTASVVLDGLDALGGTVVRSSPWDFAFSVPLGQESNTFTLVATDPAGNRSSLTLGLIKDIPLALTITSPENDSFVSEGAMEVTGTWQGPAGTLITVNDTQAVVNADGTYQAQSVPLVKGLNVLNVVATSPTGVVLLRTVVVTFDSSGGGGSSGSESTTRISVDTDARAHYQDRGLYMLPNGNAVEAWSEQYSPPYGPAVIWARHYTPQGGWEAPTLIETQGAYRPSSPMVVADEMGNAVIAWWWGTSGPVGYRYRYWMNRFDPATGWSAPFAMDSSGGRREDGGAMVTDSEGNITVVWRVGFVLYARRYDVGSGWSNRVTLRTTSNYITFDNYPNRVTVDSAGNVLVHWREEGTWDVWTVTYRVGTGWETPKVFPQAGTQMMDALAFGAGNSVYVYRPNFLVRPVWSQYYLTQQGWQAPMQLDNDTTYGYWDALGYGPFKLMSNASGAGLLLWKGYAEDKASGRFPVVMSFNEDRVWQAPHAVDYPSNNIGYRGVDIETEPTAAVATNGDIATLWCGYFHDAAKGTDQWGLFSSRYGASTGWGATEILLDRRCDLPAVRLGESGNTLVEWRETTTPTTADLWARTASSGGGQPPTHRPVVTAPANQVVEATALLTPVDLGAATAFDEVDGVLVATPDKTGPFAVGDHYIFWTATNSEGAVGTSVQRITVRDSTAPVVTLQEKIHISVSDPNTLPIAVDLGEVNATDIFEIVSLIKIGPDTFDIGTTYVGWMAVDAHKNVTVVYQAVTVEFTGSVLVDITSPANGTTVNGTAVDIQGRWLGPANTGITVNGVPAMIHNGSFYANGVPLHSGANTLTATATTPAGGTHSDSITVDSLGQAASYKIELERDSGPADFTAALSVINNTGHAVSLIQADFNNDGIFDDATGNIDDILSYTYTAPGVYTIVVEITEAGGNTVTKMAKVVVQHPTYYEDLFNAIWNGMNNALLDGNVDLAVSYLTESSGDRYRPVFEALLENMPEIIESYSPLQPVTVASDFGEFAVTRQNGDRQQLYLIYFLKDDDGVWRLDAM